MKGNCPVPTFGCCPVRHLLSVLVPLFLCFLPFCPVYGQVWLENFSGAPPAPGWNANFPDCDNTGASFNGVRNGRYEVQDREGNCCPALDGGDNEGYWTTNAIDISAACNVSVSVRYGSLGVMECEPGGPHFGCTPCPSPALPSCITDGHDQMVFQYRVDGGPWIQFGYVCGNGAGVFNSGPVGAGNTIEIRINAANKSVSEVYWFDDVTVLGANAPVMNPVADVTVCAGQPIVRNFTPTGGGITYSWTNSNTLTGLPAAGTGNINVPSNSTITTAQTGTVTVTPRIGACIGTPRTFNVTVVPGTSVDPIPPQTFCAGAPIVLNFSSTSSTATYNWTNSNVNTGIPASGMGNINVPANAVTTVQNATLTVRANESGCLGPPRTVQITVRPLPTVNQPNNITRCAGQNATINFAGTGTPVYEWTNSNPAIGLGASGTGNINFATAAPGGVQQTATITVTPRSGNCVGNSVNFTITVNPPPVMQDPPDLTVCPGDPIDVMFSGAGPGATYSWTNTNAGIGVPTSGSGNISAVATGSANPIIGVFTVRATENSCIGLPQNFSVVVSPAPVLNAVSNVTRCSGQAVTINFGGTTGATFQWSNNNTSTGLAASGTGNISFTAATVTAAQTSSITVTPRFGNCTGTAQTFTLTITPGPVVNAVASLSVCGNDPVSVTFTGSSPTATYTWSNNNTNVGIGASGTGNISGTAAAVTTTETAVINVVANDNGCTSAPRTFNIVVSPPPVVSPVSNISTCAGSPVSVLFNGTTGATFAWSNSNSNIGLTANGTGSGLNFTATNGGSTTETAIITVTPRIGTCNGVSTSFTITIQPPAIVNTPSDVASCLGGTVAVNFSGTATAYSWSNSNTTIGLAANGNGNINFNATALGTATVTVQPTGSTCPGTSRTFIINITNTVDINPVANVTQCNGDTVRVNFTGTTGGTYQWTNNNTTIGLGAAGSGPLKFAGTASGTPQTATVTVTPSAGSCTGLPVSFNITIRPGIVPVIAGNKVICAGDSVTLASSAATAYQWNGGQTTQSIIVKPLVTTTYTVRATGANGCSGSVTATVRVNQPTGTTLLLTTCNPTQAGVQTRTLKNAFGCDSVVTTITTLLRSDTTRFSLTTCVPAQAGVNTQRLTNRAGCDSLIITTTTLLRRDTTRLNLTTCNPAQAGTTTQRLTNRVGCDSLVITTTALLRSDTTRLTARSCNPAQAGTTTRSLTNRAGCDSLVILTTVFDPAGRDTTRLTRRSCNPAQTGTTQQIFPGSDGCDSLVITNTVLSRRDTTRLSRTTCNPAQAGTTTRLLPNLFGCDSLVITTTNLLRRDTTRLGRTTCNPAQAGTATQRLTNRVGCDSLVITTTTLLRRDTTRLSLTTCNPAQAGTATQRLTNRVGCDSLVITTTTLLRRDTTRLSLTTCNATQAGMTTQRLTNRVGCDSLVITTTALLRRDTTRLTARSCNPAQAGTTARTLTNRAGCDSLVILTTVFDPAGRDTTRLTARSCNPAQAGTTTRSLTNRAGCDSLVILTTLFDPAGRDTTRLTRRSCNPAQTGTTQQTFPGSDGCDSLVITTTVLSRRDTTRLSRTTCNPAQAGTTTRLLPNLFGCDSLVITTTTLLRRDTTRLNLTTCNPAQAGVNTQRLTNRVGCDSLVITTTTLLRKDTTRLTDRSCNPAQAGTTTRTLTNRAGCDSLVILTIVFDPAGRDTTRLTRRSCNPAQTGTTQQIFPGSDGCDSLVITNTVLSRRDTTRLSRTTCNPAQAGTTTRLLPNLFGCDSLVITTTTLLRRDTTRLGLTTCNPAQAGTNTQRLTNRVGCDSLVITTTTLLRRDTTRLSRTTCNPAQAGTVTQRLTNRVGCDSLVITTTTLLRRDTTRLTARSCNPAQTGVSVKNLTNRLGCDSVVITTTTLLRSDTTRLMLSTCLPQQAGTTTQRLTNRFGCDSLVITTVLLARRDTTRLSVNTCNPLQAGTTTKRLLNRAGCDSLVITTTALLRSDTTRLSLTTCIPAQAGTTTRRLTNRTGCDSLVITTTTLLRSDTTRLRQNTCDPLQAGTTTRRLTNRSGCDSLVITTTALLHSDTTRLNATTCASTQTGTSIRRLKNLAGCDSLVITTTTFDPVRCNPQVVLNARPATCADRSDGTAIINLTGGEPPFQYVWSNSAGATGSGNITSLNTPVNISNMPPGEFKVTITQPNSTGSTTYTIAISAPGPVQVNANAILKAPPYAVRCASDQDASAATLVSGGTGSYLYSWNNNATTSGVSGLKPGIYTVTVTDQNRCSATASVQLKAPPSLSLRVQVLTPVCGATTTEAFVQTEGGLAPYILRLNGNFTSDDFLQVRNGSNTITATDANGCSKDTVVQVSIPPVISLYLPRDTSIRLGQELTLTGLTNAKESSLDTIIWSPLADSLRAGTLTQVWRPLVSNVYKLTLIDKDGCQVSASTRVLVRREANIYVPNVFTPNGDGRNDILTVSSSEDVQNLELVRIFDRWGNMVYEWEGSVAPRFWPGWDGKTGNDNVGVGVYVYYLRARLVNGDIIFKDGDITVAR